MVNIKLVGRNKKELQTNRKWIKKSKHDLPLLKKRSKKFSNLLKKEAKMSSLRNWQLIEAICCNLAFKQVVGCLLSTFKPIPESENDNDKNNISLKWKTIKRKN